MLMHSRHGVDGADYEPAGCSSPSHGENRGSSPLGSANDFNDLVAKPQPGHLLLQFFSKVNALKLELDRTRGACAFAQSDRMELWAGAAAVSAIVRKERTR